MNILVTGATGFIGRHLTKRLIRDGHSVVALVRESSDTSSLPKDVTVSILSEQDESFASIFQKHSFDGVIHLATHFLSAHEMTDIETLIDANITFGTKVIEGAAQARVPWFVNTSTFSAYSEEDVYEPANLYSATKKAFEDIVSFYAAAGSIQTLTLLLFNTFGENDTRKKIFNLWKSAIDSQTPIDMSPGEQIIDINHIDNIVDGFCRAIALLADDAHKSLSGKTFSLPSSERMTLRELGTLFFTTLGQSILINFGAQPYRPNEIMEPIVGTPLPGWTPQVTLVEGIKRTYANS